MLLAGAVTLMHLMLASRLASEQIGDGAADTRPRRIEVSFVRELAPAEPVPVVAPAPPPQLVARAAAAEPAASAPVAQSVVPPQPMPEPELARAALVPPPDVAVPTQAATDAASSAPAEALAQQGFEWPPSTRLSYRLTGNFNGPVEGQAQVEWLRMGSRYQVHLDVSVGPFFAPLVSRRLSSEGEITERGLAPRRYDEETKALLRTPRVVTIQFDAERVRLPGGREFPRPAGVQDSASQFVQLTWMFTLNPQLLQAGQTVEIPLALPRQIDVWTYDVGASETLQTPAGPVAAVHVKPRREPGRGGDLSAEVWFAPSLQYLPVRIVIRQSAQNYVDLMVERLPQQAAQPGR